MTQKATLLPLDQIYFASMQGTNAEKNDTTNHDNIQWPSTLETARETVLGTNNRHKYWPLQSQKYLFDKQNTDIENINKGHLRTRSLRTRSLRTRNLRTRRNLWKDKRSEKSIIDRYQSKLVINRHQIPISGCSDPSPGVQTHYHEIPGEFRFWT